MKLKPMPMDEYWGYWHWLHSENSLIHMGIYRVMYGFRVRSGFCTDTWGVYLDWCGGANWADVERLYSLLYAILSHRPEDKNCFKGLPTVSAVKPFYNDPDFLMHVLKEAGENFELKKLERLPNEGLLW